MIERAPFGRTGHLSSRVLFGAAALSRVTQETADSLLPHLLAHGVNHLDTAPSYGDSELRLAPWLAAHPGEFFIATKTGERDGFGARASLERSLGRLGVDRVDLVQLHNLVEEEEFAEAHGPNGAVAALARARDEGLVRFIGVTGHGLRIARMHLRSLERFPFDSVLFPYNHLLLRDASYRRDVEELLSVCAAGGVATQAIKTIANRRWQVPAPREERRSWYEPLSDNDAIARAIAFALARSQLFLNSSSDYELLPTLLAAAEAPPPVPTEAELDADVAAFSMRPLFDGGALEKINS